MGIQKPELGFWDWVWDAVTLVGGGSAWPDTDEDSIRQYGKEWQRLAEILQEAGAEFQPTVEELRQLWVGISGANFQRRWRYRLDTILPQLIDSSQSVAEAMDEAAMQVEHEKLVIIVSVIVCCIELAIILIAMFFSGGLASLAGSGPVLIARAFISNAYHWLLRELQHGFVYRLLREALLEGLQEFGSDFTAQTVQKVKGTRDGYDGGSLWQSFKWGSVGGTIGFGLNPALAGLRNLTRGIDNGALRWAANVGAEGLHDQVTNQLTNYLANGVENNNWAVSGDAVLNGLGRFGVGVVTGGIREQIGNAYHGVINNFVNRVENPAPVDTNPNGGFGPSQPSASPPTGPPAGPRGTGPLGQPLGGPSNPSPASPTPTQPAAPIPTPPQPTTTQPPNPHPANLSQPATPSPQPTNPPAQPTNPSAQPGSSSAQPGNPPAQPGNPPAQPGNSSAQPGNPSAQPGNSSAQPGNPSAQPGNPSVPPTNPAVQPGNSSAQPGGPSAQPANPSAQPANPSAQPANPAAQSGSPSVQPANPAAQPGSPATQPANPVAQPGSPATQPANPVAQPGSPATQPANPVAQPGNPATQPANPAMQPTSPAAQSSNPAAPPGNPSAQPGNASAQPGNPSAQPAAQSGSSAVQPGSPSVQAANPATQPGTPAAQPASPAAQPGNPAAQSGKLEARGADPVAGSGGPGVQPVNSAAQVGDPTGQSGKRAERGGNPLGQSENGAGQEVGVGQRDLLGRPGGVDTASGRQLDPRWTAASRQARSLTEAILGTLIMLEGVADGTAQAVGLPAQEARRLLDQLRSHVLPGIAQLARPTVSLDALVTQLTEIEIAIETTFDGPAGRVALGYLAVQAQLARDTYGVIDMAQRALTQLAEVAPPRAPLVVQLAEQVLQLESSRDALLEAAVNGASDPASLIDSYDAVAQDHQTLHTLTRSVSSGIQAAGAADRSIDRANDLLNLLSAVLGAPGTEMVLSRLVTELTTAVQGLTIQRESMSDSLEAMTALTAATPAFDDVRRQIAGYAESIATAQRSIDDVSEAGADHSALALATVRQHLQLLLDVLVTPESSSANRLEAKNLLDRARTDLDALRQQVLSQPRAQEERVLVAAGGGGASDSRVASGLRNEAAGGGTPPLGGQGGGGGGNFGSSPTPQGGQGGGRSSGPPGVSPVPSPDSAPNPAIQAARSLLESVLLAMASLQETANGDRTTPGLEQESARRISRDALRHIVPALQHLSTLVDPPGGVAPTVGDRALATAVNDLIHQLNLASDDLRAAVEHEQAEALGSARVRPLLSTMHGQAFELTGISQFTQGSMLHGIEQTSAVHDEAREALRALMAAQLPQDFAAQLTGLATEVRSQQTTLEELLLKVSPAVAQALKSVESLRFTERRLADIGQVLPTGAQFSPDAVNGARMAMTARVADLTTDLAEASERLVLLLATSTLDSHVEQAVTDVRQIRGLAYNTLVDFASLAMEVKTVRALLQRAHATAEAADALGQRHNSGWVALRLRLATQRAETFTLLEAFLVSFSTMNDPTADDPARRATAFAAMQQGREALAQLNAELAAVVFAAKTEANEATMLRQLSFQQWADLVSFAAERATERWGGGTIAPLATLEDLAAREHRMILLPDSWNRGRPARDPRYGMVRIRFTTLPDQMPYRLTPSLEEFGRSLESGEQHPESLLELPARLAADPNLDELLTEYLRQAAETIQRLDFTADRASQLIAGTTLPAPRRRHSAQDKARIERLIEVLRQPTADLALAGRLLSDMGLLDGQNGFTERRRVFKGWNLFKQLRQSADLSLLLLNTRHEADPAAVRRQLDSIVKAFAKANQEILEKAELRGTNDQLALRVQLAPPGRQESLLTTLPVHFDDSLASPVRLEETSPGVFQLSVRPDASAFALEVGLAGAIAEFQSRSFRVGDPVQERARAQVQAIKRLRARASEVERIAFDHLLNRLHDELSQGPHDVSVVTEAMSAVERADAYHRRAGLSAKEFFKGPDNRGATARRFHFFRRSSSAIGNTIWAFGINDLVGRGLTQSLTSMARSLVRDNVQGWSDFMAAALKAAGGAAPQLYRVGAVERGYGVFQMIKFATIAQNLKKRNPGAYGGGTASQGPQFMKQDSDYAGGFLEGSDAVAFLRLEMLVGEALMSGYMPAFIDFGQDKPEKVEESRHAFQSALLPDTERNAAVEALMYRAAELARQIRQLDRYGRPSGDRRANLLRDLAEIKALLRLAEEQMREDVTNKVMDMAARRDRSSREAADIVLPDGTRLSYTPDALGLASGAPSKTVNIMRVGGQQFSTGVQSAALQGFINLLALTSANPELALAFTLVNGVINIAGMGGGYGGGWSAVKIDEMLDNHAVAAWQSLQDLRTAAQSIESAENLLNGWNEADRAPLPAVKRRLTRRVMRRYFGPKDEAAARLRAEDEAAGRPAAIDPGLQYRVKHGWAVLARISATLPGAHILVQFGGSPLLYALMPIGQAILQAAFAVGETEMRVDDKLSAREERYRQLQQQAAISLLSFEETTTELRSLTDQIMLLNGQIMPSLAVEPETVRKRASRAWSGVKRAGREIRAAEFGLTAKLQRRANQLRPGPNRPGAIELAPRDKQALNILQDTLRDFLNAKRNRRGGRPALLSQVQSRYRADLIAQLAILGLLADGTVDSQQRWEAAQSYLQHRFRADTTILSELRQLLDSGRQMPTVYDALNLLRDGGHIAQAEGPLRMIEVDLSQGLRFVAGTTEVTADMVTAVLPEGVVAQLRPATADDPVNRMLLTSEVSTDPGKLAAALAWAWNSIAENDGIPPAMANFRPGQGGQGGAAAPGGQPDPSQGPGGLHREPSKRPRIGRPQTMDMDNIRRVAAKYEIDITGLSFVFEKEKHGPYTGKTEEDGTIVLTRAAFYDEQELARTLIHEWYHVTQQVQAGMGMPTHYDPDNDWEQPAIEYENLWWDQWGEWVQNTTLEAEIEERKRKRAQERREWYGYE